MKIVIETSQYRDRTLLVELFDLAIEAYKQHAVDANLDDRLKEQFVSQVKMGGDVLLMLWHQTDRHEITFHCPEGESSRWLVLNMLDTGIDLLEGVANDAKRGIAKTQYLNKVARANELREMIEDAAIAW